MGSTERNPQKPKTKVCHPDPERSEGEGSAFSCTLDNTCGLRFFRRNEALYCLGTIQTLGCIISVGSFAQKQAGGTCSRETFWLQTVNCKL